MGRHRPKEGSMTRRSFLKRAGCLLAAGLLPGSVGYSLYERHWLRVDRSTIAIPGLPRAFSGLRVGHLTDIHHGPWLGLSDVREAIELVRSLEPDMLVLTGDYVHRGEEYIEPVWEALSALEAPLGVCGVLGNHDQWEDEDLVKTRRLMRQAGVVDLTNRTVRVARRGQQLYVAGVGDLWTDEQRLAEALAGVPADAAVILLSHNPDYNEELNDRRVKLMLAGHTHGGQVVLPLLGALVTPSAHGRKYVGGLVRDGWKQVYVSRGVGMAVMPVRFNCRPEVGLLTLVAG